MVTDEVDAGFGNECREACHEVERLEDDVGGSISVRRLELVTHVAVGRERQPDRAFMLPICFNFATNWFCRERINGFW